MAVSLMDEIQNIYIKFDQSERKWLNRLSTLNRAYDIAYQNFTSNLAKGVAASSGMADALEVGGGALMTGMSLAAGPAAVAVPLMAGLKKLAALAGGGAIEPPSPDVLTPKEKITEVIDSFRATTEHFGDRIVTLIKRAEAKMVDEAEIRKSVATLLISPIWYPPQLGESAHIRFSVPMEMRMWYRYWKQLLKMSGYKLQQLDLSKMGARLKAIKWSYSGVDLDALRPVEKLGWGMTFSRNWEIVQELADHGQRGLSKPLVIPTTFPKETQKYLEAMQPKTFGPYTFPADPPNENNLPASVLNWSAVGI